MKSAYLIAPEIFLSVVALGLLVGEAFYPQKRRTWINIGAVSLILALLHQLCFFTCDTFLGAAKLGLTPLEVRGGWVVYPPVFGMISVDSLSVFFKVSVMAATLLILWLSLDYWEFSDSPMGTYTSLLLLATVGMMFLVGSTDFLMAVIGLELLSIASFILTGFVFKRRSSSEAAIKFFLVGTLSTAILLYGISFYYGYFGTTQLSALLQFPAPGQRPDLFISVIVVFLLAGLGFKLAMVPFHMWAPDAYEGAPTPITAFLSVAPKAAAVGFLVRLLANHEGLGATQLLAVLAALTMTVGNIGALHQTNIKRLLAYSSIAQVGYILVALVGGGSMGSQAAMVYTFLYLFMNLGVFAALLLIAKDTKSEEIQTFAGLSQKSTALSLTLVCFLLSLTGIPPMAGFVGKFTIFASVITKPELLWLGIVAVINSVISLYYYFKIVYQMYFQPSDGRPVPALSLPLLSCLIVALGITLVGGLLPNQILGWVRNVVGS